MATLGVFEAIGSVFSNQIDDRTPKSLNILTPTGRLFTINLANDPDVSISEATADSNPRLVAIEIKGGSDTANVYNRGGEAEKSHQGAKAKGYDECWTVIRTTGVDFAKLRRGSPTTDYWFDTTEILVGSGGGWDEFEHNLRRITGV